MKNTNKKGLRSRSARNRNGIDFFIDPPEDLLIKKGGLDAVKLIRAERA